jgi:hypothetical protein
MALFADSSSRTATPSWQRDADFRALLHSIGDRSLLDADNLHLLHRLARQCSQLGGAIAEVGVYRGGSARLLGQSRERDVPLHLFDTFRGLPAVDAGRDVLPPGEFADVDQAEVERHLADVAGVHLHPGFFPATAFALLRQQFCLVHCDASIYQTTLDCCRTFYGRLLRGGALLIEGYGGAATPGVADAVDEFFANKAEVPLLLPTGQALAVKL